MKRRRRQRRQFAAAIILAVLYSTERFGITDLLKIGWRLLTGGSAPRGTSSYFRRLRCCYRCPVFHVEMRTCGSPISKTPELGCWCFMPKKAALPNAECWIDEQGFEDYGEYGWNNQIPNQKKA